MVAGSGVFHSAAPVVCCLIGGSSWKTVSPRNFLLAEGLVGLTMDRIGQQTSHRPGKTVSRICGALEILWATDRYWNDLRCLNFDVKRKETMLEGTGRPHVTPGILIDALTAVKQNPEMLALSNVLAPMDES